jgi:MOSC domain-containing protein YiiM
LQAGTAVLRVSDEPNDGCAKWKVRMGKAAYDWTRAHAAYRLRGLYCSVEQDGEITLNDALLRL